MTTPERTPWRGVALPAEHGGWGLTLEPVVLGLAVAPSLAGAALGTAALAAFLFRTPFKIAVGDRRRSRLLARTSVAHRAAAVYGLLLVVAVAAAARTAGHPFWPPLAAAAPLIAVQAGFDVRSRSRRLVPELAGPVAIGSVAAAIALAGGEAAAAACGLWLVCALRSVASVVLVRAQLRRAKEQPYRTWAVHATGAVVAATGIAAAAAWTVPILGGIALAGLAPFGWWSLSRPPVRAVVVGIHQTVLGALVVILTAIGAHTGL